MMLPRMLSALLFGACVTLVAASAQPFARATRRPTRWIWAAALAVATLWPVVSTLALVLLPSLRETVARLSPIRIVSGGAALGVDAPGDAMPIIGRCVVASWGLASAILGMRLVRALVALRRLRGAAERRSVDGVEVLLSDDLGPATIGLRQQAVVVPRAVLDLEEPLRRLLLRHESEHRSARDPWLLLAGSVAVVLFPWNAALWLIAHRLRLALEIDCDARVLAGGGDPVRYGRLLLLFAQGPGAVPLALTLAATPSQLERRIIAMRTRLVRPRPLQLAGAGMLIVLGVAGACSAGAPDAPSVVRTSTSAPAAQSEVRASAPAPNAPSAVSTPSPAPDAAPVERKAKSAAQTGSSSLPTGTFYEFQVDQQVRQVSGVGTFRYPPEMKDANREGEVLAQFVVDEEGSVDMSTFEVLKTTDPAFSDAVRAAVPTLGFKPARVKGRAVKQLVQQPFTFSLARS